MRFSISRTTLICIIAGIAFILVSLSTPLLKDVKAHAQGFSNPGGKWNLVVKFSQTGEQDQSTIKFDSGNGYAGEVINYTPYYGIGWWMMLGQDHFFYMFYELITQNNVPIGYVLVTQYGTLSPDGNTYTASGTGTFCPFNGSPYPASPTTTTATRANNW